MKYFLIQELKLAFLVIRFVIEIVIAAILDKYSNVSVCMCVGCEFHHQIMRFPFRFSI